MTRDKWKRIGRICGYDGTRTASVWSEDAQRLREACPYELWKRIFAMNDDFATYEKIYNAISYATNKTQFDMGDIVFDGLSVHAPPEFVGEMKKFCDHYGIPAEVSSESVDGMDTITFME
jgi:hypothetical protein